MGLDPSILLNGAAQRAQIRQNTVSNIIGMQQAATDRKMKQQALDQQAMDQAMDIDKGAERALFKAAMGAPMSEEDNAFLKAWDAKNQTKLMRDPTTGEYVRAAGSIFDTLAGHAAPAYKMDNAVQQEPLAPMSIPGMSDAVPKAGASIERPLSVQDLGIPAMDESELQDGFDVRKLMTPSIPAPDTSGMNPADAAVARQESIKANAALQKEAAKTKVEKEAGRPKAEVGLLGLIDQGQMMDETIRQAIAQTSGKTAGLGSLINAVRGTPAYDLKATLDTIKADAAFDTLQQMRAASPTGGALGAVSEKELALLQAAKTAIDEAQSPAQLKANLEKYRQVRARALQRAKDAFQKDFGYLPEVSTSMGDQPKAIPAADLQSLKSKYGLE